MKALVFHALNPNFREDVPPEGGYRLVAELEIPEMPLSEAMDFVFQLTNHIDSDWTKGNQVVRAQKPCRSTSVGDVIRLENDPNYWLCCNVGWKVKVLDEGSGVLDPNHPNA